MWDNFFASVELFFALTWWFWAFIILLPLFISTWLFWRQEVFKHSIKWTLLELKIPREIRKSPKAMEQLLMVIHGLRNAASDVREKWWDGEITRWYSLEIVSFGGEIHYYLRLYYKQRNLVEAGFFSYYPDVEVIEVEDYTERLPKSVREMKEQGYELWGSEMMIRKESAYPIKSYLDFESPDEDKQYDPMSVFLEVLGKIKKEEFVGIQILIAPASPDWKEKWYPLVEELRLRKEKEHGSAGPGTTTEFPGGPLPAFSTKTPDKDQTGNVFRSFMRTPGETDVLKAVEENLSQSAFDTLIRFAYLSPKELFYDSYARRGIVGSFNQYGALDINSFKQNSTISTRVRVWQWPFIFPNRRNEYRKERVLVNYIHRDIPHETFMGELLTSHFLNWNFASHRFEMSVRSLATLFHMPTFLVLTAPHLRRIESRKTGPPAGLPIYGEEGELERFH
ncbi:hypothetical protein C4571_03635 [Candidatus Parcubacteria bacterium]|nr:MAG: hypothetical protein C4571_03635 [Candidatus Parcubacteria bacterium]